MRRGAGPVRPETPEQAIVAQRQAAVDEFLAAAPEGMRGARITLSDSGLPKSIVGERAALTAPSGKDPVEIAKDFLRAYRRVFPFTPSEIENLRLTTRSTGDGATFLSFNQTLDGINVFHGQLKVAVNAAGEVVHAGAGDLVPSLTMNTRPKLAAEEVVRAAMSLLGMEEPAELERLPSTQEGQTVFRHPRGEGYSEITAELSIFPLTPASGRLAWRIFLEAGPLAWYEMLLDAEDARLLFRHNLYQAAQGRVWKESPLRSSNCSLPAPPLPAPPCARETVQFPAGWLPPGGTVTSGNNVDAFVDVNADNVPDSDAGPNTVSGRGSSPSQDFNFPAPDGATPQDPRGFKAASTASLFYFADSAHDFFYNLGFDEASGNFQNDNFGRGGQGNDAIVGQVQWASAFGFLNNAFFATPPDGQRGRMTMGIFAIRSTGSSTQRDGSYDGHVVIHEYTHGVSTRLVGGGTDVSCLHGTQGNAMGEGWSDYFAISFFNNPVFAAYSSLNTTVGIRRRSYDGYPFDYQHLGNAGFEEHNDGEIWAAALWDLRTALGQTIADRLIVSGLKMTPCNPSMIDARNGILAADQAGSGGANRARIWEVFARHGMGDSASGADGSFTVGTVYTASFDKPADLQPGNRPPRVTSRPPAAPGLGDRFSYRLTATDPDDNVLFISLLATPPGMTFDEATQTLQWTATFVSQRVAVRISDARGASVIHGFLLVVDTPLRPDVAVTASAPAGGNGIAHIDVPAGQLALQVTLRAGIGDADLVVADPDGFIRGQSLRDRTSSETLTIPSPQAGRWTVVVVGLKNYQDVQVTAGFPIPPLLSGSRTLTGVGSSETLFRVQVPPGASSLRVSTSGGTGDVFLMLRRNAVPTCGFWALIFIENFEFAFLDNCVFDTFSAFFLRGTSQTVTVADPPAGDWYVNVKNVFFSPYTAVNLSTELRVSPTLVLSANTMTFTSVEGSAPPAQTLNIYDATGGVFNWTAAAATESGGSWLQLSLASGTGNANVQVSANPAGLSPGSYRGTITVTGSGLARSPQTVAVTLTVTTRPALAVGLTNFSFTAMRGQDPAPQTLAISNTGGGTLNWTAVAATTAGGNWLAVNPTSGTGNVTVQVAARVGALGAGIYRGTITVSAIDARNSPVVIAVALLIDAPAITPGSVVNAASFLAPLGRGGIAALFGSLLANFTLEAGSVPLPKVLGGTRVLVGGFAAPLFFVSPLQINFQVPFEVPAGGPPVLIIVERDGLPSQAVTAVVVDFAPGVFTYERVPGSRDPIVTHADGSLVTPENPALAGETVVVYLTGVGGLNDPPPTGAAALVNPLSTSRVTPDIIVGGQAARSVFAGLTAGFVGLMQLNVELPAGLPAGRLVMVIRFAGNAAQTVELAIR